MPLGQYGFANRDGLLVLTVPCSMGNCLRKTGVEAG